MKNRDSDVAANATASQSGKSQTLVLQPADWDAFLRMLDDPAEPTPALIALMKRAPPWEE